MANTTILLLRVGIVLLEVVVVVVRGVCAQEKPLKGSLRLAQSVKEFSLAIGFWNTMTITVIATTISSSTTGITDASTSIVSLIIIRADIFIDLLMCSLQKMHKSPFYFIFWNVDIIP